MYHNTGQVSLGPFEKLLSVLTYYDEYTFN